MVVAMPEPLSSILTAAGGAVASEVAKKTWHSAERWLREKFGSHAVAIQDCARENATAFVHQLAVRVAILENRNELKESAATDAESDPQVSSLLQKSLLNSAKTGDAQKHELLAHLVAARLASNAENHVRVSI